MQGSESYGLYKRETMRRDREELNLAFLLECKELGITPNWIIIKNKQVRKASKKATRELEVRTLNNIIRTKRALVDRLQHRSMNLYIEMYENTVPLQFDNIMQKTAEFREKQNNRKIFKQYNKMNKLKAMQPDNISNAPEPINYVNISDRVFSPQEEAILTKGPKYIIDQEVDPLTVIPTIERIVTFVPENAQEMFRNKAALDMRRIERKNAKQRLELRILKSLKQDPEIMIIETDKSKRIAVLNKSDYIMKMEETIGKLDCKPVTVNPLNRLIKKTQDLINTGIWPPQMKNILDQKPSELIPRIIAKLKDHKDNMPLRPIVNKNQGPTYYLEKAYVSILKELMPPSPYVITSAKQFCKDIRSIEIEEDSLLVSLDIVQLYPSIDIKKASELFENMIMQQTHYDESMQNTLVRGFNLMLFNNYFMFNDKIYHQLQGAPMGSPASGYISELILRPIEEEIMRCRRFKFKKWSRYVDDTFVIWEDDHDKLEAFLAYINNIDERMQFTMEKEKQGTLAFLDIEVIRSCRKIETRVYRKPMASEGTIKFGAKTTKQYQNAAYNFSIDRALDYCSNENFLLLELEIIKRIAKSNGFPGRSITKLIEQRMKRRDNVIEGRPPKYDVNMQRFTIKYIPGFFENLKKQCIKYNINLVAKASVKMGMYLNNRFDKVDMGDRAGIYELPYFKENDEKGYYIGVTSRKLKKRIYEHQYDLKKGTEKSALTKLEAQEGIRIDFGSAKIIADYETKSTAFMKESLYIYYRRDEICNKDLSWAIPEIWKDFLDSLRSRDRKLNNTGGEG